MKKSVPYASSLFNSLSKNGVPSFAWIFCAVLFFLSAFFSLFSSTDLRSFDQKLQNEQAETSQNVSLLNHMKDSVDGTEEETVKTCNGETFLKCMLGDSKNLPDFDDLADFIECKRGKDYHIWLKDKQRHRKWKGKKMAVLRFKKKRKTWKLWKLMKSLKN